MNKAFEKILERLQEEERFYNSASDSDQYIRKGVCISQRIVQEITEEYNNGWIPCTVVDHPEHNHDCEVTMMGKCGYEREIAFYVGTWRRASDEAKIAVVAWKEPTEPYQPKGE